VPAFVDQHADSIEPLHVSLFGRRERIRPEVRENLLHQISNVSYFELDGFVGPIGSDEAASPSFLNYFEELGSVRVLADRKARSDLPTQPMSAAWLERNAEAAFSIDETGDVGR